MQGKGHSHDSIIATVKFHENELRAMGVRHIALFGSWAKETSRMDSDIDLLFDTDGIVNLEKIKAFLNSVLSRDIDLVRRSSLDDEWRNEIISTAIEIF